MYKTLKIMSYELFTDNISKITIDTNVKIIIATINPHSYVTAKTDKEFKEALHASDTLLPDGSGIVLAAKHINKKKIDKVAGADLHMHLLTELNRIKGRCFYMGASQHTLDKIHQRINQEFPNIKLDSYSPPFKEEFSNKDNDLIISNINEFNPDVLFIGMTAPKQEKWLIKHKDALCFKVATPIGAVFDFYAGTVERSSQFWIDLHLEWLPRLLKEPKRLWKRNFVSTPLFLIDIVLFKFGLKK